MYTRERYQEISSQTIKQYKYRENTESRESVFFLFMGIKMYEYLSVRKIKNCILAKREMLDESAIDDCKMADCSMCGWNKYEIKRRKIKQSLNANSKHWKITKGTL